LPALHNGNFDSALAPIRLSFPACLLARPSSQQEYAQRRQHDDSVSSLAAAVQRLVEQLSGLSGDVFGPADAAAGRTELGLPPQASLRQEHLHTLLQMLLPWVTPPAAAVQAAAHAATSSDHSGAQERLQSACLSLLSAAAAHRAAGFEAASAALGLASSGGLLALLSELTSAVLSPPSAGLFEGEEEVLLEMWVELVTDPYKGHLGSSPAAIQAAAAVFSAVTAQGLQQAAGSALEDEGRLAGWWLAGWGWEQRRLGDVVVWCRAAEFLWL
jgi:hypothetical protein